MHVSTIFITLCGAVAFGFPSKPQSPHHGRVVSSYDDTTRPEGLVYQTFLSPPVSLRSGQIANTPGDFGPLDFPKGPIAVQHFHADVVDDTNTTVSLKELYVHHWLIYNNSFENGGECPNLSNIWGIGAELYHTEYNYPKDYAIITTGEEIWGANLHFIRTTNVDDVQACIECRCPDSTPEHPHGGVMCCPDGGMCWGMHNSTLQDSKNYYLRYTVGYKKLPELPALRPQPLTVFSLDVTSTHTVDCLIQYDIPQLSGKEQNVLSNNNTIPQDLEVVYIVGHQHIGGVGISVDHFRAGKHLGQIWNFIPQYGNSTKVGDEADYVVAIPSHQFDKPYNIKAGDVLQITSIYESRTLPGGHNYHEGVMGLVYMAAVASETQESKCLNELHDFCGPPPYVSAKDCDDCAKQQEQSLTDCTVAIVKKECSKTLSGHNIPAPDTVKNMTLHVVSTPSKLIQFTVTSTPNTWFGIAVNDKPIMTNATAFVAHYVNTNATDDAQFHFSEMILGNHAAGTIVQLDYPLNAYQFDAGIMKLGWLASHLPSGQVCYLFAQGETGTFGYHGASRGFTCVNSTSIHEETAPIQIPMPLV